ncbi:PadR family transcriptional regulator [Sphaerisporangium melleum]|uniref:PadR family transcriptional regulator n=1 Tax=Sphaerisporangium melleum TaxID=321316 RepID=A0A917QRH2_9ACTN|nr:PadR family transcriptional regulator [Sphaerisporangium melleum]GGK64189.1 PadR family transcriptional regulator [Sphaerisporangium melleum]GII70114.1 PadR family transcriptional regulator [Sphaerisporangium melleum]
MPLSHAVLALLADGPSHGYELKSRFEMAIGPQWGGLNIGHLYQILDRLVRDGHVVRTHVAQNDRPDKTLYELTAGGAGELRSWVVAPHVRASGFRDEMFLKLLAATRLGPRALTEYASAQRQACLSDLAGLTRLRRDNADDPLVALLVDAAIAHTKADLQVIDTAERRLASVAGQAGPVVTGAAAGGAEGDGPDAAVAPAPR